MKVLALGVGTPTPTVNNWGSSFVVEHGDTKLMFDCGPAATDRLVRAGGYPTEIGHLFLTHLHFDHVVDLPALLLSLWDQGGHYLPPIEIVGPQPTDSFVEDLIGRQGAFRHDIEARIGFPGSQQVFMNRGGVLPRPWPETNSTVVAAGDSYEGDGWRVVAGHAQHVQPYLDSLAYRLETDAGSVVFTGDTGPCDEVVALAAGADVLYSMCWDLQGDMRRMKEDNGQTGPITGGQMAAAAGVGTLVLVHHGPNLDVDEHRRQAIEEAESVFDGRVVFADEGLVLDVG
jgi:ribonuclease Z